jgi:hypothetical protein
MFQVEMDILCDVCHRCVKGRLMGSQVLLLVARYSQTVETEICYFILLMKRNIIVLYVTRNRYLDYFIRRMI